MALICGTGHWERAPAASCDMLFYMVSFIQPNGLRKIPELKQLQDVQEEIYRQLHLLIPDQFAFHDSLVSRVSGSPILRLEVLERHRYTTFLRLTYEFRQGQGQHLCTGCAYPFLSRCPHCRGDLVQCQPGMHPDRPSRVSTKAIAATNMVPQPLPGSLVGLPIETGPQRGNHEAGESLHQPKKSSSRIRDSYPAYCISTADINRQIRQSMQNAG